MSFIPTAKGLVYNMDLFVAQLPVNHSLTLKPLDYKNNGSHATVFNLLSKDFKNAANPHKYWVFGTSKPRGTTPTRSL